MLEHPISKMNMSISLDNPFQYFQSSELPVETTLTQNAFQNISNHCLFLLVYLLQIDPIVEIELPYKPVQFIIVPVYLHYPIRFTLLITS